ncbi:hypothetical protein M0812_30368 [Anaeramoeba flamelloides]|uniref:Uncharacterized protein n=1 Tax=Anaeramoeba flamelloides TaxID=1746091 RepID=A0AAV7Y5M1_9EUKA|nr:hypothetical protein M0812_30368 [Anaeramoeba flamelloides]
MTKRLLIFCNELWAILIEINKFNSNNNNNNNEGGKEREKEKEKLKQRLEKIYQQNISYDILLYWFNKRFVDRLNVYFANEPQQKFCEKYLFYLGKSKFILSCLLLPSELIKKDGIVKQYYQLINKNYDGNPLNLYFNNRGKKVKLVKSLILAYGVNNGKYWEIISKDFCEKLEFNVDNIFEHFPFKQIISNPGLSNLCTKNVIEDIPPKKRTVVNQNDTKIGVKIRVDWLLKKRLI